MQSHDAQVLVVGGGPAGSTAAFFLARAGCDVLLIDRSAFPRDKPCSEYLSPQASRLLDEMGVLDSLEAGPSDQLTGMRVHAPDGTTFEGSFSAPSKFRPYRNYGLAIRRPLLDTTLLLRAEQAGLITYTPGGRRTPSTFELVRPDEGAGGWAKLPRRDVHDRVPRLPHRGANALIALKLYLILLAHVGADG